MASERQIAANRANALRSTGPRTTAGKLAVAGNGLRHGILARGAVLPGVEHAEEWESHQRGVVASLRPAGLLELRLAERVAELLWRMGRVARYESLIAAVRLEEAADLLHCKSQEDGGRHSVGRCRTRLAEAEAMAEALRRLDGQRDEDTLTATAARAIFDLVVSLVCPGEGSYYLEPGFWANLQIEGMPSFDDVAWTAGMVRKVLRQFAQRGQLCMEELSRRMAGLVERTIVSARAQLAELEEAERAGRAALEVAVGREQVRRLLPDAKTEQRLERYERHLSRELREALGTLERMQAQRLKRGGPGPSGAISAGPNESHESAHLATIGFALPNSPEAAEAERPLATDKDAQCPVETPSEQD